MRTTSMVLDAAEQFAPVVSEENDRLLLLKEWGDNLGELLVDPWPGLRAWLRRPGREYWEECAEPWQFYLSCELPLEKPYCFPQPEQGMLRRTPALSSREFFHRFNMSMGVHLYLYTKYFTWNRWRMLHAFRELGHAAGDMFWGSSNALLFMLAHLDRFGSDRVQRWERAGALIRMPQRNALAELGFPGTESIARILRKVPAASCEREGLRFLRCMLRREPMRNKLCHLRRINLGVIYILRYPNISRLCTPALG